MNTVTNSTGSSKTTNIDLDFTVTPAKGTTFKPTRVYFEAARLGHSNGKVTVKATYGDNTTATLKEEHEVNRNGNNSEDLTVDDITIANGVASEKAFKLTISINKLDNNKADAFRNVKIFGLVNGTPVTVTLYTITAESNDNNLGTVTGGGEIEENTTTDLTATPKTGAKFVKWLKDGNDFSGNTSASITVTATADATYTANFAALNKITYAANGGAGSVPSIDYIDDEVSYTIPTWKMLYKEGYTFSGWNDGTETRAAGYTFSSVTSDITLTAQWTPNAATLGDAASTATWSFDMAKGAPSVAIQDSGATMYYVVQSTVSGNSIDVPLYIDATSGKFDTKNHEDDHFAQVNGGTKFTLPAVQGMIVTYTSASGTHTDASNFEFDDAANVTKSMVSNNLQFTYNGKNSTITFTDNDGAMWPSSLSVSYPKSVSTPGEVEPVTGDAITWDFTDLSATDFAAGVSYSFTADDDDSEMRFTADSSDDKIIAKNGTTPGYLKENGRRKTVPQPRILMK